MKNQRVRQVEFIAAMGIIVLGLKNK